MSQFSKEYNTFFTSPAGIEFRTWLTDQRTTEHDRAEEGGSTSDAFGHIKTAKAYREVLDYIDNVQVGVHNSRSSSGAATQVKPD